MTDEEAAEAYVERYGYPFWQEGDTELDRRRYSCDGCDQSQSSIKEAFLAGVEHGRQNPWILTMDREPPQDTLLEVAYSRYADVIATTTAWHMGNGIYRYNEAMKPGRELDDHPYAWRLMPEIPKEPSCES